MSNERAKEVLNQVLADFLATQNVGPNTSVPVKTVWTRAMNRGVTQTTDLQAAFQLGVDDGLLTYESGGIAGMGTITMTDAGYQVAREL
jgi:hypothetical protein